MSGVEINSLRYGISSMGGVELNPAWLDRRMHLAFLNRGFDGQWDGAQRDFYLARSFAGVATDILVRADGEKLLATASLAYRQIGIGQRERCWVAVASACSTLPCERGRGHYAALMQAAIARAYQQGCSALIGFVTRSNGSGRGLVRLGAVGRPSYYVLSEGSHVRRSAACATVRELDLDSALERAARELALESALSTAGQVRSSPASVARFVYVQRADWISQFLRRPGTVRAIGIGHDSIALLETIETTDRLQWIACPPSKVGARIAQVAAASVARGRRFFTFTMDPLVAARAQRSGLCIRGGYLMVQPVGAEPSRFKTLAQARWSIHCGDRL